MTPAHTHYQAAPRGTTKNPPNQWCDHEGAPSMSFTRAGLRYDQCMRCGQTWIRPVY